MASASLGSEYAVILWAAADSASGDPTSIVELTRDGAPVFWSSVAGEKPSGLSCLSSPQHANCVVLNRRGANGTVAHLWILTGGSLHAAGRISTNTPRIIAQDLNGDGVLDIVTLRLNSINQFYWETLVAGGLQFTSTGCTPLASSAPPAPAATLVGKCPR